MLELKNGYRTFIREAMVIHSVTKVYVYKTMYTDNKMQI
jgi:hypothetical protein